MDALIRTAAELLRGSAFAVALTGAGISTASGIPDFRSPESGLWQDADSMLTASLFGFRTNPQAFFEWVRPLARLVLEAQPNPAHYALSQMEAWGTIKALITQNIDMLHTRAGSRQVSEVHGNLRVATCLQCSREEPCEPHLRAFMERGTIPRCPTCGGILKPNVVLFGEQLPYAVLQAARKAAAQATTMLIAGSSLEVAPVCLMPEAALAHGANLIIVNYQPTPFDSRAQVVIHEDVAQVLPRIAEALEAEPQ